jgi:hypothetical protein
MRNRYKLPKNLSKIANSKIPYRLAEMDSLGLDVETETEPFFISFKYYKEKKCEVNLLLNSPAKKALTCIMQIGMVSKIQDLPKKNIGVDPINRNGNYSFLYNGLGEDVEIRHHDIGSSERLFYADVPGKKIVYIILIKSKHIN